MISQSLAPAAERVLLTADEGAAGHQATPGSGRTRGGKREGCLSRAIPLPSHSQQGRRTPQPLLVLGLLGGVRAVCGRAGCAVSARGLP